MKNKTFFAILLLSVVLFATSCASQKYGCPANVASSRPFRA